MFLHGIFGFPTPHCYTTPEVALTAGETIFPLPIDREPDLVQIRLVNIITQGYWPLGAVVEGTGLTCTDGAGNWFNAFGTGYSPRADFTDPQKSAGLTLFISTYIAATYAFNRHSNSGLPTLITPANWRVRANAIWYHP